MTEEAERGKSLAPFLPGLALVLAAVSLFTCAFLFAKLEREGRGRRDQSCMVSERTHREQVRQLAETYRFLQHPPTSLRDLVPFIVVQLPRTEAQAREQPPAFCREPGIGLPNPEPKFPRRPAGLR